MPDARTHDIITVVTGLALAPVIYTGLISLGTTAETALQGVAIVVAAHLLSGLMFSPDLDIDSAIDNRWGIFYWIWRPYMWIVPHRSRLWSHGLVIAPLLRLIYFYLVVSGVLIICTWPFEHIGVLVPNVHIYLTNTLIKIVRTYPRECWCFIIGFISGSAAHSIADWLVTGGKHWLRRLGLRVAGNYSNHDQIRRRSSRSHASLWS